MLHDFVTNQIDITFEPLIFSIFKGLREINIKNKNLDKISAATLKLSEYYQRLKIRRSELKKNKKKFIEYDKKGTPINDLYMDQIKIIDKIESFHQHVYSTMSALILLVNHIGINEKREHPINSVISFLDFVKKQDELSYLKLDVYNIKKSVIFRDKCIDHPQQHLLYKWSTYLHNDKFFLIYTIESDIIPEFVTVDGITDYEKLINSSDYYISPDDDVVFKSLKKILVGLTIGKKKKLYSFKDMVDLGIFTLKSKQKNRVSLEKI